MYSWKFPEYSWNTTFIITIIFQYSEFFFKLITWSLHLSCCCMQAYTPVLRAGPKLCWEVDRRGLGYTTSPIAGRSQWRPNLPCSVSDHIDVDGTNLLRLNSKMYIPREHNSIGTTSEQQQNHCSKQTILTLKCTCLSCAKFLLKWHNFDLSILRRQRQCSIHTSAFR